MLDGIFVPYIASTVVSETGLILNAAATKFFSALLTTGLDTTLRTCQGVRSEYDVLYILINSV